MCQTGAKTCSGPPRDHLAGNQERSDLRKFQPGPKHHEKDLYEVKSLQVVILKSLLSRLALGRIALDSNWIYIRLSKFVER